ncbi:MAG: DUF5060 domain-containing protein [Planctomycetes bacterium]|nr:DUF5060 domain-containing protein [Planctomycetota bacterium]
MSREHLPCGIFLTVALTTLTVVEDEIRFAKWSKIELSFRGPASLGRGEPNPFAAKLDVDFRSPGGRQYCVPGFYDGDGRGGLGGDVWKVRFSADETGSWTYTTSSDNLQLNGTTGQFTVTDVPADAEGVWRWGRLEAMGKAENAVRYLKFRDGPYWLKAGCDDPENFLGGGCKNYDTLQKRKAAIDYLAECGINSLYMMTNNIDGDDKDVWPWLGETAREAKVNSAGDVRFDVARLDEWSELFETMQTKGVVVYLVLEDDNAWQGYDHERYYREIIARFGYLPGLIFNFNEEYNENYKLPQALEYMQHLADLDPYDHPRGIHNVNTPTDAYIDAPQVDFTAIQTGSPGGHDPGALSHNQRAIDWIERCRARESRVLMVGFDEGRPEEDRRAWWSAYLGGGVWEAHVLPPYDRPMSAWERVWTELGGTRAFMESLPFWEMEPANDIVQSGKAFCLAKRGEVYALYLPEGGEIEVDLPAGQRFMVSWWNPNQGRSGKFTQESRVPGGRQTLAAPAGGDWAVRIVAM